MHLETKRNRIPFRGMNVKSGIVVYAILIGLLIVAEIISPGFIAPNHMESVLRQASFLGIVSIGQTLVILTGGIDLSVASIITLANVVSAQIMDGNDSNILMAFAAVLLIGIIAGLINGVGIHYLRIPPLVMTLGVGSVIQGIALVYSKGAPKGNTAPFVKFISTGKIGGMISGTLFIWIVLAIIAVLILKFTIFGRSVYAIGVNTIASRYSGINVPFITIIIYTISGIMAAVTGLLLIGYTGTSFLNAGDIYSMNSIAAVVVGGTSILGGSGGYIGTIAGAIIMTVIGSILTIINIPVSGRQIAQGLIIILLVLIYGREKNKR
ncbi:ABC transporter permease [Petroclostridium sp. X23]|jgi:ribose transport system permease protein|uniref:ABC transporter permease n=1 Tax=Petroclostridium sp. X23 TaxID=3045146 RepID=UPI0024AE480F|nr:ABC transporter permease [Petroclostridium sp. X23]WHH58181.1 ABC transporter permease [Petroclostridium sp. X23]